MNRARLVWLLIAASSIGTIAWIANKTYWADTKVPMPPKGEALVNPFYATQRIAWALGAGATWDRVLTIPPTGSVLVLSQWNWSLSDSRRRAIEGWVETGGRLVVDVTVANDVFQQWSGIEPQFVGDDETAQTPSTLPERPEFCRKVREVTPSGSPARQRWLCDFLFVTPLTTKKQALWSLTDGKHVHAMRVAVGQGSVTLVNGMPFIRRAIFDGDHAWLFVEAAQLRPGDDVRFLSQAEFPSLLALTWQHGAPIVLLTLAIIALAVWRSVVRHGPLVAPPELARRSLAEQIRGTGQFAARFNGGDALHTATVRAFEEVARRRVPGYAELSPAERAGEIARITGFEREALLTAIYHPAGRDPNELRSTIALVETARRRALAAHTRTSA